MLNPVPGYNTILKVPYKISNLVSGVFVGTNNEVFNYIRNKNNDICVYITEQKPIVSKIPGYLSLVFLVEI